VTLNSSEGAALRFVEKNCNLISQFLDDKNVNFCAAAKCMGTAALG